MKNFIEIKTTDGELFTLNKRYVVKFEPSDGEAKTDIYIDTSVNPQLNHYYRSVIPYNKFKEQFLANNSEV